MNKRELQIQAEKLIKNNSQEKAMVICKKLWNEFPKNEPEAFNLYDALLTLKATKNNQNVNFKFIYKVTKMFSENPQVKNSFSWFIFFNYIKGSTNNDIIQNEHVIVKLLEIASQKNLRINNDDLCVVTIAILNLVKAYSKGLFNATKIIEWLNKLNPNFLSKEVKIIPTTKRGDIEDASDLEKYYALSTKALLKLEHYQDCKDRCKLALKELNNFHYDNYLWLNMRIAICEENLGNIVKSEHLFQEILNTKAGSDKWFIYREISILYFEKGDYENAWSYAVDSAFYGNEPEYMIGLFLLQARILVKLYRIDESKILAELIGAILKEKGWKNKQEYSKLLAYHNINMQNIKSAKSLFRKAKKFWISERYEGLEQEKGVIIFIHPKGKVGKIKSQEGHVYNFHKRDFNRKQRYLSTLKNAEVVFVVMNDLDNKQVAENIKVLKTEKSTTPNQFKVGALKTVTIKNFADFGIFVKLNENQDGLLHKNRLPNHLKETFKMEFTPGQNIKVEIIKVTEKGPELKLAE